MKKPTTTCGRVCWRSIIRLVPTIPPSKITRQSHQTGLKLNIRLNESSPPATPPMAAEWVDTFHHTLVMAQSICTTRAAMSIEVMVWGVRLRLMM